MDFKQKFGEINLSNISQLETGVIKSGRPTRRPKRERHPFSKSQRSIYGSSRMQVSSGD